MPVQGIGGLFFRATDPEALGEWYREHLGVGAGLAAEDAGEAREWCWMAQGGPVVFAPFKADTDYFAADKAFMLNLRVTALDEMLERLNAAGIAIETREEWDSPEAGRFARIHDPEGNAIELWELPPQ
ncbi:VOC family protein [Sphingomonas baiyangensis]|uniref:VOC family protein n=1 Tax=Sphingomonas baiyangensis TaxID=2572576 RepID=A0A4U1L647_9SPHN|nr:VOC family protein [Sphingomonas baiyangensis]TKD51783.1 VOC family protein [Sphingomonas baiyangensis]